MTGFLKTFFTMSALEPTYVNTWYTAGIQETLAERKKRE